MQDKQCRHGRPVKNRVDSTNFRLAYDDRVVYDGLCMHTIGNNIKSLIMVVNGSHLGAPYVSFCLTHAQWLAIDATRLPATSASTRTGGTGHAVAPSAEISNRRSADRSAYLFLGRHDGKFVEKASVWFNGTKRKKKDKKKTKPLEKTRNKKQ